MKQNMCVTIDEEIHSWLKKKNEMMSRLVNGILWKAMQKEIQTRALSNGQQTRLELDRYCHSCNQTQTGIYDFCINKECDDHGTYLEVIL